MPINFLTMPALQDPGGLNFQPLAQGFDAIREGKKDNRLLDIKQQAADLDRDRFGLEKQRFARTEADAADEKWATRTFAIANLPPEQRAVAWQQHLASNPKAASLPDAMRDPINGPAMTAAAWGKYKDQQAAELQRSQIGENYSKSALHRAQAEALGKKDEITGFVMEQLRGGQPAAAPAQPRVQPQSMPSTPTNKLLQPIADDTQADPRDPNLILTQGAPPPQQAPPMLPPDQRLIDTPMGKMTAAQAKKLSFALAMGGKHEAGKMLNETADKTMLGKEAGNENDKRELKATESLSRLKSIAGGFRPEWLTFENKIKQGVIGLADSFETLRGKLPPDELRQHAEYTMFKRDAMANLTEGIRDATGAAMGVQEEKRIRAGLPDPEKDGPTAFAAKTVAVVRELNLGVARYRYLRDKGFKGQPWNGTGEDAARVLPIEGFKRMMDGEGDAMARDLKQRNPNASDAAIEGAVKAQLRQKFRMDI